MNKFEHLVVVLLGAPACLAGRGRPAAAQQSGCPLGAALCGDAAAAPPSASPATAAVSASTSGLVYAPVNVWPYPRSVGFGDGVAAAQGPYALSIGGSGAVQIEGCGEANTALLRELLEEAANPTVAFRGTARSYDEAPYANVDGACPAARRCSVDADCGGGAGAGLAAGTTKSWCYASAARAYNSTHACPPSSPFNAPCGCCVSGTAGARSLPALRNVTIACNSSAMGASPRAAALGAASESESAGEQKARQLAEDAYELRVTSAGGVSIVGGAASGAAYAIATLGQLARWDGRQRAVVLDRVPVHVADGPAFPWRGLMVDVSRHFVPMAQLLSVVDAMFAAKLNVFHLHLTDAPSFPYGSAAFPELAAEGSWSSTSDAGRATTYTAADMAALAAAAERRFVQLVLEFDTPAHTMSWGRSHPEIMADCWRWLAQANPKVDVDSDDCLAMDPTAPAARALVAALLAEAAAVAGPRHRYLHLGGDEVKTDCWDSVAHIKAYATAHYGNSSDAAYRLLQVEWTREVTTKAAVDAGKTPVLWQSTPDGPDDPAWAPHSAGLPNSTVMMAWLSAASVAAYAKAGQPVVNTIGFYVADFGAGGWQTAYSHPVMPPGLTAAEQALVLGGHVCIWGESFDGASLPVLAYQVSMGAAENFWGKWDGNGNGNGGLARALDDDGEAATLAGAGVGAAAEGSGGNSSAPSYWWAYAASDCPDIDLPGACPGTPDKVACCTGQTVAQCKETCAKTVGCTGFNFPHGILKGEDCLAHKAASATSSTLYVLEASPQPPPPPTPNPPPPPQWVGSWALNDRYNRFLCHLKNYGVVSPPTMPSHCGP
jgi:hexosaminidase